MHSMRDRKCILLLLFLTAEQSVMAFLPPTAARFGRDGPADSGVALKVASRSTDDLLRRALRLIEIEDSGTSSEQLLPTTVHPLRRIANVMGLFLPPMPPSEAPYASTYWSDPRIHSFGNVGSCVFRSDYKIRLPLLSPFSIRSSHTINLRSSVLKLVFFKK
jgi:hypothetical protein